MLNDLQSVLRDRMGETLTPEVCAKLFAAAAYLPVPSDPVERITHHFGGKVAIKEVWAKPGDVLVQHMHEYDHLSYLARGSVELTVDGKTEVVHNGATLLIEAGKHHGIKALTDVVWLCIHATEAADADSLDDVVVSPGSSVAAMRAIAEAMDTRRIKMLPTLKLNVAPMLAAIQAHPEVWNHHTSRTEDPRSPHHGLDDVWLRYAAPEVAHLPGPHTSVWYAEADLLPVRDIVAHLMQEVGGKKLGGVLLTRIPAGAECKPHVDTGWHAGAYEKFAVQIAADPGQAFHFEGEKLITAPGDVFWFNNAHKHWVTNPTDFDRITLIACIIRED